MNSFNNNRELNEHFKKYLLRFDRKNKDLNQSMHYYDIGLDINQKNNPENGNYLFKLWLEKYKEKTEKDYYKQKAPQKKYINDPYTYDEIIKTFQYFNYDGWTIRLTEKFLAKIQQINDADLPFLYAMMTFLQEGYFAPLKKFKITIIPTHVPFCLILIAPFKNQSICCMIGVHRFPSFDNFTGTIYNIKYVNQLSFLDIGKNQGELLKSAQKLISEMYSSKFIEDLETILIAEADKIKFLPENLFFFKICEDKVVYETKKFEKLNSLSIFKPNILPYVLQYKYSKFLQDKMNFNYIQNIWTLDIIDDKNQDSEKFDLFKNEKFAEYFNMNSNFKKAVQLVEFLERIPNFAIKLTRQEKKVIGQEGNVLVLGRSGTGKTTCLVLRLFAMEFLFKLRMKQVKKKFVELYGEINDDKFGSKDIDKLAGLHSIFVTASPVLCQEVKNYYEKLKNHVKIELVKKEENDLKKKEEEIIIKNENKNIEEIIEDLSFENVEDEKGEEKQEKFKIKVENAQDMKKENNYEIINDNVSQKYVKQSQDQNSLSDLKENEFPCFFTIKQLIFMIDADLRYPYLVRNYLNRIVGYNDDSRKAFDIDNYYDEKKKKINDEQILDYGIQAKDKDDQQNIVEIENNYLKEIKKIENKKDLSPFNYYKFESYVEIDYPYFEENFWNNLIKKHHYKVSCSLVWTQIYSVIKGSRDHFLYASEYENLEKSLTNAQKKTIYQIYCEYENFKRKIGAFDLMDIVIHIFRQISYGNYINRRTIHYLMVDEVQDLPHSILILLSKISSKGLFFSGDTAQNIAKGVGFRFCDLRHVFTSKTNQLVKPVVTQLSINFRSHQNILNLGNSIVALMELVFPNRIDHLKKEKSQITGPKPFLISASMENSSDLIFHLLNETKFLQIKDGKNIFVRPNIEFGCNQVILVRSEESKKKIPSILSGALCLTIFEAKGLEFDDVILFNFFDDPLSAKNDQWKDIMKLIEIKNCKIKIEENKNESDDEIDGGLDNLDAEIVNSGVKKEYYSADIRIFNSQKNGDIVEYQEMTGTPKLKYIGIDKYASLCNELKELYTAVTRARKKLIIIDQNVQKGSEIKEIWKCLNLVEFISEQDFHMEENKNMNKVQTYMKVENKEEWKKQGIKFFNNKNFEQACKCFEKSGEDILYEKSKLNLDFLTLSKKLEDIEIEKYIIAKKNRKKMVLFENQNKIKDLKLLQITIQNEFNKIAEIYLKNNLKLEACECYLRSKNFESAAQLYIIMEMWNEAAEMFYLTGNFHKAAELYSTNKEYIKMMECYQKAQDYDSILKTIDQFRSIIPRNNRLTYLKQYFPKVLEKLVNNVDFEEPFIENKKKKTDLNNVQEIKEEDEDVYDSDDLLSESEEEEENDSNGEEIPNDQISMSENKPNKNNSSFIDNFSFVEPEKKEISFEKVGLDFNHQNERKDMSFEKVGLEADLLNNKVNDDYDHLSNIDFDDEWIRSENHSIIGSILSSREKKIEVRSEYSGFENVDPNSLNPNYHIIKTKGDIFIQDETMKKIIEYIKTFSKDFFAHIADFRSKEVLLTTMKNKIELSDENFVMDLDNIDMDFLFMILDVMETYNQFKLCIFVCNRYTLNQRVGRYLISIAHRYSFLANEKPPKFTYSLLYRDKFLKNQQENAFVVSTAIHNVLENINPHYLKFKVKNEICDNSNDLGTNTFQGLILLGCWKKCIYLMDYKKSLALASSFADFTNYKYLFLKADTEYSKKIAGFNQNSLKSFDIIPFEFPKDNLDIEFLKICLKQNIWDLAYLNSLAIMNCEITIETDKYPKYFELNSCFHEFVQKPSNELFDILKSKLEHSIYFFKNFKTKNNNIDLNENLMIFDFFSGIIQIIFYLHNKGQKYHLDNKLIIELVDILLYFIDFLEKFNKSNKYFFNMLEAILIPFRITIIAASPLLNFYGNSFLIVHRTSFILVQIMKNVSKSIEDINQNVFPLDLDYDLYLVSRDFVLDFITHELRKIINELLFAKISQDYFECLNLNQYVLLSKSEKQDQSLDILNISAMMTKILEKDRNQEKNEKYKSIIKLKTQKKGMDNQIIQKTIVKYDEKKYQPDILKKIENEEKQLNEGFNTIAQRLEKNKFGKFITKDQYFFKIFKHIGKVYANKLSPQQLNTQIKDFLLNKSFRCLKKADNIYMKDIELGFKKYLNAFNLLKLMSSEWLFYEKIRYCKKECIKSFSYLIDAKIYEENGCIEEFSENIFNYLSKTFHISPLEDKITKLEETVVKLLIAKATNNKINSYLSISHSLMHYLDKYSPAFNHTFKINPISNLQKAQELIFECFYWLKKISSYAQESYSKEFLINKRIFNLLLILILNTDDISEFILIEIKTVLSNIDVYKDFYESIENLNIYDKLFNENLSVSDLRSIQKNMIIKNESEDNTFFMKIYEENDPIVKIKIGSKTNEEIDENYANSDGNWLSQFKLLAQRIISKKILIKFFKNHQMNFKKILKNLRFPPNISYSVNEFFSKYVGSLSEERHIKSFLAKNKFILKFYEKIQSSINLAIQTYYLKIIDDGLDFHYILTFLNEILTKLEEFEKSIIIQSNPEIITNTNETIQKFIDLKSDLEGMNISFEDWRNKKHVNLKREVNLDQNKKLIALKFAKRHLYRSANKLYNQKNEK